MPFYYQDPFKPISFLIGKWRTVSPGRGKFPSIKPFRYEEELEFVPVGQTILNYRAVSWNPETRAPLYIDAGFLRINPITNQLAFLIAHNFGATSVEETVVDPRSNDIIRFKTTNIGRMAFVKDPVKNLRRVYRYKRDDTELDQLIEIETAKTPLTEHLHAVYKKVR